MCGIAGIVQPKGLQEPEMRVSLEHRGPDSAGTYQANLRDWEVQLYHTRLSIIDLSDAGAQPMTTADGAFAIIYNGEVYNFKELKRRYLSTYAFRSDTDTEVLLYLYRELGPGFVKHLNGAFSMAIWDEPAGVLRLYRDRMGIKPLYLYQGGGRVAFSSEIKSFHASGYQLSLREESIQSYLVFKYVPGAQTLYREVTRVSPGHMVTIPVAEGTVHHEPYWHLQRDPAVASLPYDEAKQQLYDLLGDAVRIRLLADVPVGTFLSGGLDSSAIAHYLKDEPQITHYCARKSVADLKKEGTTSDYDHARQLADDWGIDLRIIDIGSAKATPALIRKTVYYGDDLIADGSQIPSYLITQEAGKTSRVMLSGMGADELLLGYASHLLVLLTLFFDRLPSSLTRALARQFANIDQGRGWFKAYRRYLHKLGKYYPRPGLRYGAYGIVGDVFNALDVCRRDPEPILEYISGYFPPEMDPFQALGHFERENFLVKNLHYFDRMCMANSVEGRVPFMDHRVVEFTLSLPRTYRLSNRGYAKRILKDAMRGHLPSSIIDRRKAGFGMPLRSIFSNKSTVAELLEEDFFGGFALFNVDQIREKIQQHVAGTEDNSALIYALVSFQEWYRLFQESPYQQAV